MTFTYIGESVHASIPKTGKAMRELAGAGPEAFGQASGSLDYIISLIKDQASAGAAFIEVNVDEFVSESVSLAIEQMQRYVELVAVHGQGVPVCVDSSNDDILRAGLEKWYTLNTGIVPMLNSVKTHTADLVLPWRKEYAFKFIGMLSPEVPLGVTLWQDIHAMAREIYDKAVAQGFTADDIYYDTMVFPLAIDMPMMPGDTGYTYNTMQAVKAIMTDPHMTGVHTSLGLSNCVQNLPGRKLGVCRAYLEVAAKYGLDGAIVNMFHQYSSKPADPDLVELVERFAALDGSAENTDQAMMAMADFCQKCR
ncbi:MAG: dihydropteroate synthase [Sedimentisphaerales bacterium]|nr:dihydropteroate synthase [Sedimentisphaerales bacterium]